jgi:cytidylate kinase
MSAQRPLTIAIDGPAGSGKTTVARAVAERLALPHLDTGAMYRAATLKALTLGVPVNDGEALSAMLASTSIDLRAGRVLLDGRDVSSEVRAAEVTNAVSAAAAQPAVRVWMVERQRSLAAERGGVMEGRDIATVVLPDADLKVYLTATPGERARRRALELASEGRAAPVEEVGAAMAERDRLDSGRAVAPLRVAEGAVVIDSTGKTVAEVVDEIVARTH